MVEIILFFCLIALAVLGLAEVLHTAKVYITYPSKKEKNYTLIILENGSAENQLKYAADQIRWNGKSYADGVIAVYNKDINLKSCYDIAKEHSIILCSVDELRDVIDNII